MADEPVNFQYGLTPQEARMIGLDDGTESAVSKDVELETAVIRRLRSMGAEHIHVRVLGGKAVLSGMCDDFDLKRDVVQTVRAVPGVVQVVNQIKVIPGESGRPGFGVGF